MRQPIAFQRSGLRGVCVRGGGDLFVVVVEVADDGGVELDRQRSDGAFGRDGRDFGFGILGVLAL